MSFDLTNLHNVPRYIFICGQCYKTMMVYFINLSMQLESFLMDLLQLPSYNASHLLNVNLSEPRGWFILGCKSVANQK